MDFKHNWKNVRRGPISQKSYERWVMTDGVDPEDGEGGQQNRGGGGSTMGGGATVKQSGEWAWGQLNNQVDGWGEITRWRAEGEGEEVFGKGKEAKGIQGKL